MTNNHTLQFNRIRNSFLILLILILAVYSNTYKASWHMDDYHTIVMNPRLQINNLAPSSILKTFFSNFGDENKLYRPLSCFTFALNWHMGKNNTFGYHVTNNAIHVLTSFFLFLFILRLFETPGLRNSYKGNEYFIALLAACFWAINPIQTQSITYIVQRMALLAALFYIISLLFYITARMTKSKLNKFLFFTGCFFSFLMALASKENAATLPVSLFITEIIFFKDYSNYVSQKTKKKYFLIVTAILLIFMFIIAITSNSSFFLKHYEIRPFTLFQRLLTEPRILIFYLSQFFYPIPTRLSIIHDIELSTSLFHPWTTFPSIVLIVFLIFYAMAGIRKQPLLSFAILFFFLNHIIESSVIGLELIFEHRNYLPSFFLFLPVASGFKHLIDYYYKKKQSIYFILVSFMILVLTGISIGTYTRNITWLTEKTLWEDAMAKAPNSARPPHNLAWGYYEPLKEYEKAFKLYQTSLNLYWPNKKHRAHAFYGMAGIYFKTKEYKKAAEFYKQALKIDPNDEMSYKQLVLVLIKLKKWEEALKQVNFLLSSRPSNVDYLNYKGFILIKLKKYQSAIGCFKLALKQSPFSIKSITGIGAALELTGEYERAKWFFSLAHSKYPDKFNPLLLLIDLNLKTKTGKDAERYLDKLFSLVSAEGLKKTLKHIEHDDFMNLISKELVIPALSKKIKETSIEIATLKTIKKKNQ